MYKIENIGDEIKSSDFWFSENETREYFMSWKDETCRLLARNLPQGLLEEMERAEKVLITKGTESNQYEVLFEDYTNTPPLVIVDVDTQSDRVVSEPIEGLTFTLWENGKKLLELPAVFRLTDTLPFAAKEQAS